MQFGLRKLSPPLVIAFEYSVWKVYGFRKIFRQITSSIVLSGHFLRHGNMIEFLEARMLQYLITGCQNLINACAPPLHPESRRIWKDTWGLG